MAEAKDETADLIAAAKQLPPTEQFTMRPRNFEEAYRFANAISKSTLIPKDFQNQPANVLIAVQLGMELGVAPMQALQNIYVVNGRPAIYGDLLPAIVLQSGQLETWHEEGDEKTATCTVKRKGFDAISRTFTMAEAEKAGLPARNPTYKSYPKRMLQMRARAYAMRDMFPDLLKGVGIREELEDTEATDITPMKVPQALKAPEPIKESAPNTVQSEAAPQPEPQTKKEKPKVDRKAEALKWIEDVNDDDFRSNKDWLNTVLRGLPEQDKLEICTAWNTRNQAIAQKSGNVEAE